jgi:hypothetical protein
MVERGIVRFGLLLMVVALPVLGFLVYEGRGLSCLSVAPFDFCWF